MCDTIVALPSATRHGGVLFGKNSDRERNEAQGLEWHAAATHARGTMLRCTDVEIPQVPHTHGVLLSRPFWMWGAEMGVNQHGVVIGNEALHAPRPASLAPGLRGMDLLRLALERGASAAEAVDVIVTLLERHGQGGNCGYLTQRAYHNGFIVADAREAFVLETVARDWVVQRASGVRTISNAYSIGAAFDRASAGLAACAPDGTARSLTDLQQDAIGQGRSRCARSTALLRAVAGRVEVADMMAVLRDHGDDPAWDPQHATGRTICMHAGDAGRTGQTVAALVSDLQAGVHWVTGTAAPCLSVFKPVLLDAPLPPFGPAPSDRCDDGTLWWRHERRHRAMLAAFPACLDAIRSERDALEASFRDRVCAVLRGGATAARGAVVAACWAEAEAAERRWAAQTARFGAPVQPGYRDAWGEMNRLAGMG
ncbi:MAG: hypothetical protein J0H67_05980 [Rhodospirillales bacterium]|nr:hypothetical protein [Rhodospirillales bacterium]